MCLLQPSQQYEIVRAAIKVVTVKTAKTFLSLCHCAIAEKVASTLWNTPY